MILTVETVLRETAHFFAKRGLPSARLEAELLMAHLLKTDRIRLYTDGERPLNREEISKYKDLIRQRLSGQPLAYITGKKSFLSWEFQITPAVLVPRPETEILVEKTVEQCRGRASGRLLDLGTGSGVIAISLAHYLPAFQIDAIDLSAAALEVAAANAVAHNCKERINFYCGDLYTVLPVASGLRYTGIVSNAPYIPTAVIPTLAKEVRQEPRVALDGGPTGTEVIRRIILGASAWLAPEGFLAIEHGHDQFPAIQTIAHEAGFTKVHSYQDYAGWPRVAICTGITSN
ncbi:MAG TPA: peptide chain release factor N(5)-glutamine methyltransferase [Firmicutes bacterium]|jgi:release factor glutamine methyltransferase|nr:peptide chain release factor N(5)-glutamine methyltransferase [Bacillota bacterium]